MANGESYLTTNLDFSEITGVVRRVPCARVISCTLPPIIMEEENGRISNISFLSFRKTFHFHDYLVGGWTNPCEKCESKWESSPNKDENKRHLKPPPSNVFCGRNRSPVMSRVLSHGNLSSLKMVPLEHHRFQDQWSYTRSCLGIPTWQSFSETS